MAKKTNTLKYPRHKKWQIANQNDYISYLVYEMHKLLDMGIGLEEAVNYIIHDSSKIAYCGQYLQETGSKGLINFVDPDLGNTKKILSNSSTDDENYYEKHGITKHYDFIIAGSSYKHAGFESPLCTMRKTTATNKILDDAVPLLILR